MNKIEMVGGPHCGMVYIVGTVPQTYEALHQPQIGTTWRAKYERTERVVHGATVFRYAGQERLS